MPRSTDEISKKVFGSKHLLTVANYLDGRLTPYDPDTDPDAYPIKLDLVQELEKPENGNVPRSATQSALDILEDPMAMIGTRERGRNIMVYSIDSSAGWPFVRALISQAVELEPALDDEPPQS